MVTIASIDPVPIGSEATLSCSAIGISPLTYNWTRQNNPSIVLSTNRVYTFTISNVSGYGSYVCGVSNSLGSDAETIVVVQASKCSILYRSLFLLYLLYTYAYMCVHFLYHKC